MRPTILLSHNLDGVFRNLFTAMGFEAIWAGDLNSLKSLALRKKFSLALEWQHGENDFTVREMLRQIGKKVPLIMCRNWRCGIWSNKPHLKSHGYDAALDIPFRPYDLKKTVERVLAR